jgi:hypothetical protein
MFRMKLKAKSVRHPKVSSVIEKLNADLQLSVEVVSIQAQISGCCVTKQPNGTDHLRPFDYFSVSEVWLRDECGW